MASHFCFSSWERRGRGCNHNSTSCATSTIRGNATHTSPERYIGGVGLGAWSVTTDLSSGLRLTSPEVWTLEGREIYRQRGSDDRHELRPQTDVIGNGLMALSLSPSCASERVAESSLNDPPDDETSCDQCSDSSSSHDDYIPSSTPPQTSTPPALVSESVGLNATDGSVYTTPSYRSSDAVGDRVKSALHRLYNSPKCLVTGKIRSALFAHIVRRGSNSGEVQ